jgi:hypothetical protein
MTTIEAIKAVSDTFREYSLGGCYRPSPNDFSAST